MGSDKCCVWSEDPDYAYWETSCGNNFVFECGTPTDNKFVYCPYCSLKISEKLFVEEGGYGDGDESQHCEAS